ncbi:MAG: hypothetical protein H3C55_01500 [Pseudorhodoplanes sp.]|nr:hypothetical protein [Pseudorhodoplanes sp.]MBW7948011.1 hypothetical protein [Pseudorhodoplanes sp.]MCQ3942437.1 hypothetical protein [Alphaproteobacteria bacterium]
MTKAPIVTAALAFLVAFGGLAAAQAPAPWPSTAAAPSGGGSPWPDAPNPNRGAGAAHPAWSNQGSPGASHPAWSNPPQQSQGQPPQGQPPCAQEFIPLRDDAQKKANAIKPAADSKDRTRLCQAFRTFVAAEAKVIKFVNENASRCGIPADAAKVMKTNHAKSTNIRNQVCSAGGPSGPAPAPSLSDALGTSRIPGVTATEPTRGGGTFNTLTGNPLAR